MREHVNTYTTETQLVFSWHVNAKISKTCYFYSFIFLFQFRFFFNYSLVFSYQKLHQIFFYRGELPAWKFSLIGILIVWKKTEMYY